MIYAVHATIEVEAATPELAEDQIINILEDYDADVFVNIEEVEELH